MYPGGDGYFVVQVPSLPGCHSQGRAREEAILNVKGSIEAYIEAREAVSLPAPRERFEAQISILPVALTGEAEASAMQTQNRLYTTQDLMNVPEDPHVDRIWE